MRSLAAIARINPGKPAPLPKSIKFLSFLSIKSMSWKESKKCLCHMSFIVDFPIKFRLLLAFINYSSYFFKLIIVSRETRDNLLNVSIWSFLSIYAVFFLYKAFFM